MSTASPSDVLNPAPLPVAPATIEDTGLPIDRIHQLLVKTLYGAEATGLVIADRMRLPFTMLEPLISSRSRARRDQARPATDTT